MEASHVYPASEYVLISQSCIYKFEKEADEKQDKLKITQNQRNDFFEMENDVRKKMYQLKHKSMLTRHNLETQRMNTNTVHNEANVKKDDLRKMFHLLEESKKTLHNKKQQREDTSKLIKEKGVELEDSKTYRDNMKAIMNKKSNKTEQSSSSKKEMVQCSIVLNSGSKDSMISENGNNNFLYENVFSEDTKGVQVTAKHDDTFKLIKLDIYEMDVKFAKSLLSKEYIKEVEKVLFPEDSKANSNHIQHDSDDSTNHCEMGGSIDNYNSVTTEKVADRSIDPHGLDIEQKFKRKDDNALEIINETINMIEETDEYHDTHDELRQIKFKLNNTIVRKEEILVHLERIYVKYNKLYIIPTKRKNKKIIKLICSQFQKDIKTLKEADNSPPQNSCSITTGDKNQSQTQQDSTGLHQRRMSDTVTSWNERSQFGGSPCKRFVRKLFGLPSPDRHNLLNGSFSSLRSYDSGSIISETEDSYPHLFDFGSHELMEEMTRIDKELLICIPWEELSILGWMSTDKYIIAPNIMKMVQFFNRVVMMVTTSILAEESIYRRAKVIQKAIKLALKFRYNKNFNSLKAVLGGLQCTPIFRLKGTWKQVPSRYRRVFRELSELMSEDNNFYKYRMELETSVHDPPSLPFLGNFLTTVAHTHAYVAVHVKYKHNLKTEDEDDGSYNTSPSLPPCAADMNNSETNKQTDPCIQSSTSKITSAGHIGTDSNDSGIVLNNNRLSRSSHDLETKEDGLIFTNQHYSDGDANYGDNIECLTRASEIITSPVRHGRSIRVDNTDLLLKHVTDIACIINNRPIAREERDDLYECELQFWKYQIAAVQYNILPRTYIRRYLMNCPHNTEEENYKLSLKREPPSRCKDKSNK